MNTIAVQNLDEDMVTKKYLKHNINGNPISSGMNLKFKLSYH